MTPRRLAAVQGPWTKYPSWKGKPKAPKDAKDKHDVTKEHLQQVMMSCQWLVDLTPRCLAEVQRPWTKYPLTRPATILGHRQNLRTQLGCETCSPLWARSETSWCRATSDFTSPCCLLHTGQLACLGCGFRYAICAKWDTFISRAKTCTIVSCL